MSPRRRRRTSPVSSGRSGPGIQFHFPVNSNMTFTVRGGGHEGGRRCQEVQRLQRLWLQVGIMVPEVGRFFICHVHLSGMIRSTVSVTTGGARKAPGLSVMRMNVVRSWTSVRGASAPAQVIQCRQFGNVDLMQLMVQMEIRVTKSLRKVANKDGRNGMEGYLYTKYPTNIFLSTNFKYIMINYFRKDAIIHARSQIL